MVYNTGLLYRPIRISVNKAGIFCFSFTSYLPNAAFHSRWISLSSLTYTVSKIFIYLYPSSKFVKTSLVYSPFESLFSEFEPIAADTVTLSLVSLKTQGHGSLDWHESNTTSDVTTLFWPRQNGRQF